MLGHHQLGVEHLQFIPENKDAVSPAYLSELRDALIRHKQQLDLYRQETGNITFLTPQNFRGEIRLPQFSPDGTYAVQVFLFADGIVLDRGISAFEVVQVGLARSLQPLAFAHPILFGFMFFAVAVVLLIGFLKLAVGETINLFRW